MHKALYQLNRFSNYVFLTWIFRLTVYLIGMLPSLMKFHDMQLFINLNFYISILVFLAINPTNLSVLIIMPSKNDQNNIIILIWLDNIIAIILQLFKKQ